MSMLTDMQHMCKGRHFVCTWLVQEVADQSPMARPLRRRAGLLIGQWVGKLKGEDRPLAYRALLSLLADSDPAMQLAAVASLHALIDDWSAPVILPTCCALAFPRDCQALIIFLQGVLLLCQRLTVLTRQQLLTEHGNLASFDDRLTYAIYHNCSSIVQPWLDDCGLGGELLASAGPHKAPLRTMTIV